MPRAAVRYAGTGDGRQFSSLPLERRRLLEGVLPPAEGEHADRA